MLRTTGKIALLSLVFSMAACGNNDDNNTSGNNTTATNNTTGGTNNTTGGTNNTTGGTNNTTGGGTNNTTEPDGRARVEALTLDEVTLATPYSDKLMAKYPATIEATMTVDSLYSFATVVELKLATADGSKSCSLGLVPVSYAGGEQPGLMSLTHEVHIPAECGALAGEQLKPVITFDPNGATDSRLDALLQPTRCKLQTGKSCDEGVELKDSPGRDLVLESVSLGSSVAVLHIPASPARPKKPLGELYAEQDPNEPLPPMLPPPPMGELPAKEDRSPTKPHFNVLSAFSVQGMQKEEETDKPIHFEFKMRPLPGGVGVAALHPEQRGWVPLGRRDPMAQGMAPGMPPQLISQDAVRDPYEGGSVMQHQSPVHIPPPIGERIARGDWAGVSEYELELCVMGGFEEAEIDGMPGVANNCATMPVVIIRDFLSAGGASGAARPAEAASSYFNECVDLGDTASYSSSFISFEFDTWLEYGKRTTSGSRVSTCGTGATLTSSSEVWFYAGAYSAATFKMKFPVVGKKSKTFVPVDIFWLAQGGSSGGSVEYQFQLFGYDIIDPDGITLELGEEITFDDLGIELPSVTIGPKIYSVSIGFPIDATAKVEAGLTVGIDAEETSITIDTVDARVDPCDGLTVHDGLCFSEVYVGTSKSSDEYDELCQLSGGYPAPIRDATDLALIKAAKSSTTWSFVGVRGTGDQQTQTFNGATISDISSEKYQNIYTTELGIDETTAYTNWRSGYPKQLDSFSGSECSSATSGNITVTSCSDTSLVKVTSGGETVDVNDPSTGYSGICAYRALDGSTKGGMGVDVKITPFLVAGVEGELDISVLGASGEITVLDVSAPIELGVTFEETSASDILVTLTSKLSVVVEILSGRVKWWYNIGVYKDSGNLLKFDTVWEETWKIVDETTSFSF